MTNFTSMATYPFIVTSKAQVLTKPCISMNESMIFHQGMIHDYESQSNPESKSKKLEQLRNLVCKDQ